MNSAIGELLSKVVFFTSVVKYVTGSNSPLHTFVSKDNSTGLFNDTKVHLSRMSRYSEDNNNITKFMVLDYLTFISTK